MIELLVVLGVIGILVGLLAPALSGARSSAYKTIALSNVRSTGTLFLQDADLRGHYAQQGLGEAPPGFENEGSFTPEPDALMINWYPSGVIIASTDYFSHEWMWPAMVAAIDDWPEYWETWISPRKDAELPDIEDFGFGSDRSFEDTISHRYSNSFITRPDFWSDSTPLGDHTLLRPTRPHDVRYTSSKVMLWDNDLSYLIGSTRPERIEGLLDADTPMFFPDGHAAVHNPQDASEPVLNAISQRTIRLHNTKLGVYGADY